jgi:hypothetical protein
VGCRAKRLAPSWTSKAGPVTGKIIRLRKKNTDFEGYTHHASSDGPQYEIESEKNERVAMHESTAPHKIG